MLKKFFAFLKSLVKQHEAAPPLPIGVGNAPATSEDLTWMKWAKNELGVSESNNPERVKFYHSFTKLPRSYWHTATAWCASFASAVLENSGMRSPNTAGACDFLNYGEFLPVPKYGCLVIYHRDGGGHVNFFLYAEGDWIYGLGGNQNNEVCIKAYRRSDVLGYRWPVNLKNTVKPA